MQEIKGQPGESLWMAAQRAIKAASDTGTDKFLVFNDTTVRVYPGSHEYDITDKYFLHRALERNDRR